MITIQTTYSTYEVDPNLCMIRRTKGENPSLACFGEDGTWRTFKSVDVQVGYRGFVAWAESRPEDNGYPGVYFSVAKSISEDGESLTEYQRTYAELAT